MIKTAMIKTDAILESIADYVLDTAIPSDLALNTAYYSLMDSLGCAMLALQFPACSKHLGPVIPETIVPHGVPIPGTHFKLDPIKAAFDIGILIRWLDYNDTWLAAEWAHPSDNLGAILAVSDFRDRSAQTRVTIKDVLIAMIKAYEIQGIFALENSFNAIGLDHVILVKLASTAVACGLLGANRQQLINAISQVWLDGHSLRTYRHAPNTGSRKSWAAGDATSRAVFLAMMSLKGEMGYPQVLTAKKWGFNDVLWQGHSLRLPQGFGSYVMENILFKIAFPAEFHAQTAVECAIQLYPVVKNKWDAIDKIIISTQKPAMDIISKSGPLYNPADRDHCLQYMVAIGLLFGQLTAQDYEDERACDSRIDLLRDKMIVQENRQFTEDYYDPNKRAIANAVQIFFKDGSQTQTITIEYPIGHRRRREEGLPLLQEKWRHNMASVFKEEHYNAIITLFDDKERLLNTPVSRLMDALHLS